MNNILTVDPTDLQPGDVVVRVGDHDIAGCHCDVTVTVRRPQSSGMHKIKVKVAMRGRSARTLTYQTAQDVKLEQVVEVPRWPGMPEGPPLRGTVVALESDREGPLVTIIGG